MLLCYTSFLFGIVYIYGIHTLHWFGPAFFCMMVLSSTNHYCQYHYNCSPKMNLLKNIDKGFAHILTFATAIEAYFTPWHPYLYVYWMCLCWMFYVYWISNKSNHPKTGTYWHATIHLMATIGASSVLLIPKH